MAGKTTSFKGTAERTFRLEGSEILNDGAIGASLSSENPVERAYGTEILRHTADAVNMERAGRGLPLLYDHDTGQLVGRVSDIRLDGTKLRGSLKFSPHSDMGRRIEAEVRDGFIGDVSIRYSIDEYDITTDDRGHDTVTVTRWTPLEASIVPVPADHTVGVGRSHKEVTQVTTETTANGGNDDGGSVNVVAFKEARAAARSEGENLGAKRERERIASINEVFAAFAGKGEEFEALQAECVRKGSTVEQARASLLALIAGTPDAQPTATRKVADDEARTTRVQSNGATAGEKLNEGIQRAIELRAGMLTDADAKKEAGSNEFAGMTLVELMRTWGARNGIRVNHPSASQMIGHVLTEGRRAVIGLGTSDFSGIVANVANKALLSGWDENPGTYRAWCRIGSVNDFRRVNRTGLSGMDLLDVVPEHGEYTHGNASDRTEYLTAGAYGKLFSISRAAILADDIGAFTTIPRKMGIAADMTVNKKVYDVLISNSGAGPTLNQDSTALFSTATHANYVTSSGGAPSVARLEVGRAAMAVQTDPNNGLPLNIRPKYLICPTALESTSRVLIASEKDPLGTTSATGGATTPNPFYNALQVISEPYLDVSGGSKATTAWYLVADQNMHDTFEVAFVGGQQSPYMESRDGWTVDGVEYMVRIEFGVAALDFRGMFRNDGD